METLKNNNTEEKPPFFKKWSTLYWVVFANLIFWLSLFYIFRRIFE